MFKRFLQKILSFILNIGCVLLLHFSGFAAGSTAGAAADEEVPAAEGAITALETVVVTAPRLPSALEQIPAGVTVVEKEEIQLGQPTVSLDEALTRVPGVFVQNRYNFAQDVRISIRGFGARSAFGIRGIQMYVDGIPFTLPDGQSQIDSIDPGSIERMEVMRGPISALYGNASGGVISIITEQGPEEPFVEARSLHGEFGLWKGNFKGGGQTDRANYFFNLSHLVIDGYRQHSEAESSTLNSKFRYELSDSSDLTFLFNSVNSPKLQDPGGLDREQVTADPSQAAPLSLRFGTGEEVVDGRVGLVYRRELTASQNLEAAGYYGQRDLENAIPFRFIELDREIFGGRMQYDFRSKIFGLPQQLFTGLDVQHEADDRLNFSNIDGRPADDLLLAQDEDVDNIGIYIQERLDLTNKWSLLGGGRYDYARFEVDDHLITDGDDTGTKTFDQGTGRFGVVFNPRRDLQFYANIAQSFETPTTTELVNRPEGGGGINPDVEPQKAINYEIGLKGIAAGRLTYETALFTIQLEDELIAFRDFTDRVFYRNAGESRRTGAELGLSLEIVKGLRAHLAYTYLEAEFETYQKDGIDLAGNEVPGLTDHQLFGELFYQHPGGSYAGVDALFVDDFYVDDENTEKNDGYTVVNFRTGWEKAFGDWLITPFFGVQNLLDESYNNNVRINARGGRYFEPAPGLNVYAGIGLRYQL